MQMSAICIYNEGNIVNVFQKKKTYFQTPTTILFKIEIIKIRTFAAL